MLDDLLILRKVKEGDIKAFEQLFRLYYTPLCLYASGITGRRDVAEEIIQELFYKLWKDREQIQIFRSVKSYLYAAVRNQSLQYCEQETVRLQYRDSLTELPEASPDSSPLEELENRELEEAIHRTLEKLPERRRKIFQMHRWQGLKYKEIAEALAISVKTVEAEMTKTHQLLKKEIERYII